MEEEGIVLSVEGSIASVRMVEGGGCEGCSSSGSCKVASGGRVLEADNKAGAKPGDSVTVRIEASSFLKASFIVYMVPVIFLFIGAAAGGRFGPGIYGGISVDNWQAIGGVLFLALSLFGIRLYNRRVKLVKGMMPVIIKINEDAGLCRTGC